MGERNTQYPSVSPCRSDRVMCIEGTASVPRMAYVREDVDQMMKVHFAINAVVQLCITDEKSFAVCVKLAPNCLPIATGLTIGSPKL